MTPRDERDAVAALAAGEFVKLCRDLPTPQGLAASRVLQDGDVEGGAVRRSARTREVLELDTEGSGMDLCVFLWMLN